MNVNATLIEQYQSGGQKLIRAIAGMDAADLLARPIPGKWSTHQVVIHLADADSSFADRIRRIIAMDNPVLLAWEENQFLQHLHYEKQSVDDAVTLVDLTRKQLSRVLRELPAEAFAKMGQHSHRGQQTLADVIGFANSHLDHHLKFVAEKREKLGGNQP
jgi:uncharacterized damage-inducible protein DinB